MVISGADLSRGLGILEGILAEVARLARRAPHEEDRPSPADEVGRISRTVRLPHRAKDILARLHAAPGLLDPFAMENDGVVGPVTAEFRGRLGDDLVVWPDRTELLEQGVALRADPGWLWQRLERTVRVAPAADSGCVLHVDIGWDTGSGEYEEMLGGRIGFFAEHRLAELIAAVRTETEAT
jgi:putrescine aminotransferase